MVPVYASIYNTGACICLSIHHWGFYMPVYTPLGLVYACIYTILACTCQYVHDWSLYMLVYTPLEVVYACICLYIAIGACICQYIHHWGFYMLVYTPMGLSMGVCLIRLAWDPLWPQAPSRRVLHMFGMGRLMAAVSLWACA